MAIEAKIQENKDLLQRSNIRTMKKDLSRLRELEVLKESQKIVNSSQGLKKEPAQSYAPPTVRQEPVAAKVPDNKPAQQPLKPNTIDPLIIERRATELEKQKMFLLKSQLEQLENASKAVGKEKEAPLATESSKIASEQKHWQEKLEKVIAKEDIAKEDKKDVMEKHRWQVEQELAKLKNKAQHLDAQSKQASQEKHHLKMKASETEKSLNALHSDIAQRSDQIKKEIPHQKATNHTPHIPTKDFKNAPSENSGLKEKDYLKEVPQAAKEKLSQGAKVEQEQRRKFMEDVEKWANTSEQ